MNKTPESGSQPPKHSSFVLDSAASRIPSSQYLRRALYLNQGNGDNLKKLMIKRFHIRKLIEVRIEQYRDDYEAEELAQTHRKCFKKGLFKSLVNLEFSSFYHQYWLEELKNSRKLVKFKCQPYENSQADMVISYFERINKSMEKIDFVADNEFKITYGQLEELYKRIRKFSKLKAFDGRRITDEEDKALFKEGFLCQSRYLQRLGSLKDLNCYLPNMGQVVLRDLMEEGKPYREITKLEINLDSFLEWEPETTLKKKSDRIFPFFKFQLFPNLKELTLIADQAQFLASCDSFVIKGFQKLSCLEKLDLRVVCYAPGIQFIFQGMLELPQLSACSLSIHAINQKNLETLTGFTKKQANLVSFKISWPSLGQNIFFGIAQNGSQLLEAFIGSLGEKPKLKYLSLNTEWWPLETLSKGLKRIVETPGLKSFEIKANPIFDDSDRFYVSPDCQDPVEGWCEFLLRNKATLEELALDIPLFQKQELSLAISQLSQVKNLWVRISVCKDLDQDKTELDPHLGLMLLGLEKLQELKVDFKDMEKYDSSQRKWISEAFGLLPLVKSLRRFEFSIPEKILSETEYNTINYVLGELKQVVDLDFLGGEPFERNRAHFSKILKSMKIMKAQRSLRMNLSF